MYYILHYFLLKSKYAECSYRYFGLEASSLILDCVSGELLLEGAMGWHYCSEQQSFSTQAQSWQKTHLGGSSQVCGYPKLHFTFASPQLPWDNYTLLFPQGTADWHWHRGTSVHSHLPHLILGTVKRLNALLTSLEINWPIQLFLKERKFFPKSPY